MTATTTTMINVKFIVWCVLDLFIKQTKNDIVLFIVRREPKCRFCVVSDQSNTVYICVAFYTCLGQTLTVTAYWNSLYSMVLEGVTGFVYVLLSGFAIQIRNKYVFKSEGSGNQAGYEACLYVHLVSAHIL